MMKQINKAGHILLSDSAPIFDLLLFFFCLFTYLFLKHELKGVDKGKSWTHSLVSPLSQTATDIAMEVSEEAVSDIAAKPKSTSELV